MNKKYEKIQNGRQPNRIKDWAFKVAKATIKAAVLYIIYLIVSPYLSLFAGFMPGLIETIEVFVTVTIVLTILGDLTVGTLFEYIFNAGRSFFTIVYIIFILSDYTFNVAYANYYLTVDLTVIYFIIAVLVLLGLARSILQAIDFRDKRAKKAQYS